MPEPDGGKPAEPATPATPATPAGGEPSRETSIPRERFDDVNTKKNTLENENSTLKEQLAYYQGLSQGGGTQVQEPGVDPGTQAPTAPATGEAIPQGYNSWDDWYAADPGSAIEHRARKAVQQERVKADFTDGRKRFLSKAYGKYPDLQDPLKRAGSPLYKEFARIVETNPASGMSEAGLDGALELAESRIRNQGSPEAIEAAKQAGAQAEAHRQSAVDAGIAPVGSGTTPGQAPGTEPVGTADQQKMANKYFGGSMKEYTRLSGDADSAKRITIKNEKAKRPGQA